MEMMVDDSLEDDRAFEVEILIGRSSPHVEIAERVVWSRVEAGVRAVFAQGGRVRLRLLEASGYIRKMSMDANPGNFRMLAFTSSDDMRMEILEWCGPDDGTASGYVKFDDDMWDSRKVCSDVDVALRLFGEFYSQGDLLDGLVFFRSPWDPLQ